MPWDRAKRVNDGVLTADKVFSGEQEYNELVGKLIEITQHLPDFSEKGGQLRGEAFHAAKKEYITRLEGLLSEVRTSLALKERKLSLKLEDYEWKSRSLEKVAIGGQAVLWSKWTGTFASPFHKEFGADFTKNVALAKPNEDPLEKALEILGATFCCCFITCSMDNYALKLAKKADYAERQRNEQNKATGAAPQKPSYKYDYAHLKFVLSWPASGALSAPQQNQMDRL